MSEQTTSPIANPPLGSTQTPAAHADVADAAAAATAGDATAPARLRLDPTRYGDWELNGKCVDF